MYTMGQRAIKDCLLWKIDFCRKQCIAALDVAGFGNNQYILSLQSANLDKIPEYIADQTFGATIHIVGGSIDYIGAGYQRFP